MSLIKSQTVLSDLVENQIGILPLLNRFGIRLGLGDATITEVCDQHQIDIDFFLHILNSYLDKEYLGRVTLTPEHIDQFIDYLEVANKYCLESQLPNIEVHIHSFVKMSGSNIPLLQTVPHVLEELRQTLSERIKNDEEQLFPRFRSLAIRLGNSISDIKPDRKLQYIPDPDRAEELLADIMQLLIRHLKGDFNDNLLHAVLNSLSILRNDLASNNRLRRRDLEPILHAMELALGNA